MDLDCLGSKCCSGIPKAKNISTHSNAPALILELYFRVYDVFSVVFSLSAQLEGLKV